MTLRQLDACVYDWEIPEVWKALEWIDGPGGEHAADLRAARICLRVASGPVESGQMLRLADYLPQWTPDEAGEAAKEKVQTQTPDEMAHQLRTFRHICRLKRGDI